MTIPKNLTNVEVGIFLKAVGDHMATHNVCFGAALDESGRDDLHRKIASDLDGQIEGENWRELSNQRANELLQLTGEEAVAFVEGH